MKNIDIAIKKVLQQKGMTVKDFLMKTGLSTTGYYKMIETNSLRVTTLEKIASTLEVPVSYFFEDDGKTVELKNPKAKVFLSFELSQDQEDKVLKMVMTNDFINLLKK